MKLFLLLLLMATLLLGFADEGEAAPVSDIHNFHNIDDDLLTAGQVRPRHVLGLQNEGVQMVVNLAPANEERNKEEGFLVTGAGISYVHIPIQWDNPMDADLQLFFAVMAARQNRKTLVHCFANYRASAFTYLYRVLQEGVDEAVAREDLRKVWDEEAFDHAPQWRVFIDRHLSGASE